MKPTLLTTPVLFLIFNRLETMQEVLETIRQAQPPRFYIAADGARNAEELKQVQVVREAVLNGIDWNCEVKTLFREQNLGCGVAVSTAIDWFFEHEAEGIILEDDCVPEATFFPYAQELLTRYRHDQRIMVITGYHFHNQSQPLTTSYFFSRHNHCWGWATWRRAWQYYDYEMTRWPKLRDTDWLLTVGDGDRLFQRYWTRCFDQAYIGKIDTWAFRWTLACWSQNGLTIKPRRNLVKNIGFDPEATNTKIIGSQLSKLNQEPLSFPLSHPSTMVRDYAQDRWTDRKHFQVGWGNEIQAQLRKITFLRWGWRFLRQFWQHSQGKKIR